MIHIKKNPKTGKFRVVHSGKNGEVLNVSEALDSKQSAWKNIKSVGNNYWGEKEFNSGLVQDDTLKKPTVIRLFSNGSKAYDLCIKLVTCNYKWKK